MVIKHVPGKTSAHGRGRSNGILIVAGLAFVLFSWVTALPAFSQSGAAGGAGVASDEMMLFQEIPSVYGASKYEQKVTEAPSSVSIITSDDIRKYGYRSLADILRSVRSFYITYDRNYSYVGVRGFGRPGDYNSRVLLLIDGHRANENIYDSALIGTEGIIDVDLIDRVEVIRGPGSSLYGSNAFFAVVNVMTKSGRDLKAAEVSAERASFRTEKGRLSYGDRFPAGIEAIVSASVYDSRGQSFYFPEFDPATPAGAANPNAANNGVTDHTDNDEYQNYFAKIAYSDFTLSGAGSSRTKRIPTGSFGTDFNDPGNRTTDKRSYLDLKYEHRVGSETDLTARAFYDYYSYWGDYIYTGVVNKDQSYGLWWGGEVRVVTRLLNINRLIVGAEYQDNTRQDQANYDVTALNLDDKRSSKRYASYIQDEITLSGNLLLNAGVRYDHYDTFGGTTNPRAALIYAPAERSSIKLLYGTAFRSPNVYELFYTAPTGPTTAQLPNPALHPEKIQTYTLAYEQYVGDHFRGTVSSYYYTIRDLINQTDDGFGNTMYENLARVRTRGAELELENRSAHGLDGRLSYSYQRSEDVGTGELLTNSPQHLVKVNLIVPVLPSRVFAGLEEQYTSRRKTEAGNFAPGFWIASVTLFGQRLVNNLDVSVSVYNLLDKTYGDPVAQDLVQDTIRQDGRNYRLKLSYRF